MTESEYIALKARYTADAEASAKKITELNEQIEAAKDYTPENRFLASFKLYQGASSLSRDLLTALIDRIEIGVGNMVHIIFKYRDEFERLNDYLRGEASPDEYRSQVSAHLS